jgi:hypothetical protein
MAAAVSIFTDISTCPAIGVIGFKIHVAGIHPVGFIHTAEPDWDEFTWSLLTGRAGKTGIAAGTAILSVTLEVLAGPVAEYRSFRSTGRMTVNRGIWWDDYLCSFSRTRNLPDIFLIRGRFRLSFLCYLGTSWGKKHYHEEDQGHKVAVFH